MNLFRIFSLLFLSSVVLVSSAQAQPGSGCSQTGIDCRLSVEAAIGWDNSISGNINSGGIGSINGQTVVITPNSYDAVYGTGLNLRFGGGYMIREGTELRATFMFQSLDADLVRLGDYGVSNLYGQYTDYQTFSLDLGVRRYGNLGPTLHGYAEGLIGLGFVDKTDVTLVAPAANYNAKNNDFYDQTVAMTLGANVGVLMPVGSRYGFFGQMGLRWTSGMAQVDNLVGTGLETINDKSARWSIPFIAGFRARF